MIEETAIVQRTAGELLEVEVQRRTTCAGCSAQGACGVSLLDRLLGRRAQRLVVANTLRARTGETVIIGVPEAALLRAALAAYLWPLLGLLGGAMIGHTLGPALLSSLIAAPALPSAVGFAPMPAGAASGLLAELPPLLGGTLGFAAGLLLLRGYSRRLATDPNYRAILLHRHTGGASGHPGAGPNDQPAYRSDARPGPRSGIPPGGNGAGLPVEPPVHRG